MPAAIGSGPHPFMFGSKLVSWIVNGAPLMYRRAPLSVMPPATGISVRPLIVTL